MNFAELLRVHQSRVVLLGAVFLVAFIGWLDFISPWEVSFFLLYSLPIYFVARNVLRSTAFGFAVACGILSWVVNFSAAPSESLHNWRMFNRLTAFLFVTVAGTTMKQQKEDFRSKLEAIEHSRSLEREIVRVSEREQIRIGQDLHDSVCQNLAALDCATVCLKSQLNSKAQLEVAESIQGLLKRTIAETRNLARGVFPVHVEREGLVVALEDLTRTSQRMQEVPVTFELEGEPDRLPIDVSTHLYRIAQEGLSNALRHADASHILMRVEQTADRFVLSIEDDGRGFSGETRHDTGMGLQTMGYRARLIGATLEIGAAEPRGTVIRCTLPLVKAAVA